MSYKQAMKWQKTHRKGTRQPVIFSTGSGPWSVTCPNCGEHMQECMEKNGCSEKAREVKKLEAEFESLSCSWRWGETRRFQSNKGTIERRERLIKRIAALKADLDAAKPPEAPFYAGHASVPRFKACPVCRGIFDLGTRSAYGIARDGRLVCARCFQDDMAGLQNLFTDR